MPHLTKSYQDNGDGTIKDNVTGLLWQKCSHGQNNDSNCTGNPVGFDWQGALNYCNSMSLSGKKWRLPNKIELLSIIDYHWRFAWPVNFSYGGSGGGIAYRYKKNGDFAGQMGTYNVRCVTDAD